MAGVNKAGVRKLDGPAKVPVFVPETYRALMGLAFPASVGNNGGLRVKIAKAYYDAMKVDSLSVGTDTLKDDAEVIIASATAVVAERKTEERHHAADRPQVQDSFHEADKAEWEAKKYRGKIEVAAIVDALKAGGYTPENKAPEGWLGGLVKSIADATLARRERIASLAAEENDPMSGPVTCRAEARHTGDNPAFQPTKRFVVRFEAGEPVERMTHREGGGEITRGDFFLAPPALDAVYSALRGMSTPELERAKAEDFVGSIKPYCRGCQASAEREYRDIRDAAPDARRPRFLPYGEAMALIENAVRGVSKSRLEAEARRQKGADAFKAEFGAVQPRRDNKVARRDRNWR